MKIYSLYSKSLKCFNLPFFAEGDFDAIATVSRMVTSQQDPSLICALDDLKLFKVGIFDSTDGEFPIINCKPDLVLDYLYKNLPLPPTVKDRLLDYYGGGEENV